MLMPSLNSNNIHTSIVFWPLFSLFCKKSFFGSSLDASFNRKSFFISPSIPLVFNSIVFLRIRYSNINKCIPSEGGVVALGHKETASIEQDQGTINTYFSTLSICMILKILNSFVIKSFTCVTFSINN